MVFNLNTTTTATCVQIYGRKMKSLREWRCNCRDSTAYTWNILSAHPTQYSPHIAESAASALQFVVDHKRWRDIESLITSYNKRTNAPAGQSTDRSWTEEAEYANHLFTVSPRLLGVGSMSQECIFIFNGPSAFPLLALVQIQKAAVARNS